MNTGMTISLLDLVAPFCFISSWVGYTYFAKHKAKNTNCIARCLHQHRIHWMYELLGREVRVSDAALLANLERNIAFFASTTMLVLAGVLTLFAQVERLEAVIATIPFAASPNHALVQLKLGMLTFVFVMAFFQFTWSMRQYGFLNVMVGAAPVDKTGSNENLRRYARQMAVIQDQATHSYNYGLRSYYFSMAALCWFIHPLALISASIFVVYTLYRREFKSKAVMAITEGQELLQLERDERARLTKST
ncbi:membrane protein [Shewanella schlegeliana]|nr:membrane protein [Shewanella schlegeliana]